MKKIRFSTLIIILLIITIILVLGFYYYEDYKDSHNMRAQAAENTVISIDEIRIMREMFPTKSFKREGKLFVAGERESYYIEALLPGSYIDRGRKEVLVVVRRPHEEPPHVAGLYQAYMAVFNIEDGSLISSVKQFSADDGYYRLYESSGVAFVFFAGSVTYQGWSDWNGALWQPGDEWLEQWPRQDDYWKDKAIQLNEDNIGIFSRQRLPGQNQGAIPDYTWKLEYYMYWNINEASFYKL